MNTKFEKIAQYVSSLQEGIVLENEQSFLLVGGSSDIPKSNESCNNTNDCRDSSNSSGCTNSGTC